MEWFEWQFLSSHAEHGLQTLHSSHNLYLVFLAWLVACASSLAALHMGERAANAEKPTAKTVWRWLGASCLAGGIWAMHFISMLAFESSLEVHYNLSITIGSLVIIWVSALIAMHLLNQPGLSRTPLMLAALILAWASAACTTPA